jgi:hypothetical protein
MNVIAGVEQGRAFKKAPLPLPQGNCFVRTLTAKAISRLSGVPAHTVAHWMWPSDKITNELLEQRAASAPAMTTVAGWAAELAQKRIADTLDAMSAASGATEVMKQSLTLDWNGAGVISAPGFIANAANSGFVAEGQPIPVRQLGAAAAQLLPYKLATIAVLTREMVESSNAEKLIGDALINSSGLALDAVFFGAGAATAAQPAGIRNGIAALPPSANTDPFAAVFEDVGTLVNAVAPVGGKGPYLFIAGPGRAMSFGLRVGSGQTNIIPIASAAVGNDLIVVAAKALVAALSAEPDVETANSSTLVMQDANPAVAGTTGPEKEMFQTESVALKVRWPVSWALRNAAAVAWLTPAWK